MFSGRSADSIFGRQHTRSRINKLYLLAYLHTMALSFFISLFVTYTDIANRQTTNIFFGFLGSHSSDAREKKEKKRRKREKNVFSFAPVYATRPSVAAVEPHFFGFKQINCRRPWSFFRCDGWSIPGSLGYWYLSPGPSSRQYSAGAQRILSVNASRTVMTACGCRDARLGSGFSSLFPISFEKKKKKRKKRKSLRAIRAKKAKESDTFFIKIGDSNYEIDF